jgi:hypothetical protein
MVLITGGVGIFGTEATAEIYDPTTGIFTLLANSMITFRAYHTATLLPNGKVLLAGGDQDVSIAFEALNTAELFDPATNTFTSTGPMTTPRFLHTATLLSNGQVLVAGGDGNTILVNNSAELYDGANSFASTGSMLIARDRHTATLLPNGTVLVAGGSDGSTFLASAELYAPTSSGGAREFQIFGGHSAEPSIAADPKDPSHAVVGFNDLTGSGDPVTHLGCGWAETHTSGLNWTPGSLVFPSGFHPIGDPTVRYDLNGNLYYSCIGQTGISTLNGVQLFSVGVFVWLSKSGFATDLRTTTNPVATALMTCPAPSNQLALIGAQFLPGCQIINAGGQSDDRPAIALLSLPNGTSRMVACWTDFLSFDPQPSRVLVAAYSDDGVVWSRTRIGNGVNCTLGGNASQVAVTWFNDSDQTLRVRISTDGINWNNPFILANANPLVKGTEPSGQPFFSTTSVVLSEPYGIVVPDAAGLKVVWQQGGNNTSQVLVGNAMPNAVGQVFADPTNNAVSPTITTFLPGAGSCGLIAGAYQLTTTSGQFRYKVWPLSGRGPVAPIFISGTDLNAQQGDPGDPEFVGWWRIGDYTSTACSGQMGWAAWTDTRGGKSAIYGAVIPLVP